MLVLDLPVTFNLEMAELGRDVPLQVEPRARAAHRAPPRARRRRATSAGSRSSRATSSTRSTRTTFRTVAWCVDVVRHPRMFETRRARAERRAAGPRALDARPDERHAPASSPSTTTPSSSRATTSASSAAGTASATPRPSTRSATAPRSSTTSSAARTEVHHYGPDTAHARAGVRPAHAGRGGGRRLGAVLRLRRRARGRSDVVILHAQDFAGDPVATIHLPDRVPFGFHGNWVPDPA